MQCDGGWYVVPVQDCAAPHALDAGCCWQAPETQTPVLPHSPPTGQRPFGSAELSATLPQVPLPLAAQDWQVPQLEVVQQTPSVQLALVHSCAEPHDAPFAFLATHIPAAEVLPLQYSVVLEHCVSAVQLVRHVVPLQT